MRGTILRCHHCGLALEEKRSRNPIDFCLCNLRTVSTPGIIGATSHARDLATPPAKLIQRE
jgi:hypothetical protein